MDGINGNAPRPVSNGFRIPKITHRTNNVARRVTSGFPEPISAVLFGKSAQDTARKGHR